MWGYIVMNFSEMCGNMVPSLYVRVYRRSRKTWCKLESSLIICEGISPGEYRINQGISFPHYMWGYIGHIGEKRLHAVVPSLYVRVYRRESGKIPSGTCSLIICEGISVSQWCSQSARMVPSLYVRVYPPGRANGKAELCSLIIYEGISKLAMASFRHQKI